MAGTAAEAEASDPKAFRLRQQARVCFVAAALGGLARGPVPWLEPCQCYPVLPVIGSPRQAGAV